MARGRHGEDLAAWNLVSGATRAVDDQGLIAALGPLQEILARLLPDAFEHLALVPRAEGRIRDLEVLDAEPLLRYLEHAHRAAEPPGRRGEQFFDDSAIVRSALETSGHLEQPFEFLGAFRERANALARRQRREEFAADAGNERLQAMRDFGRVAVEMRRAARERLLHAKRAEQNAVGLFDRHERQPLPRPDAHEHRQPRVRAAPVQRIDAGHDLGRGEFPAQSAHAPLGIEQTGARKRADLALSQLQIGIEQGIFARHFLSAHWRNGNASSWRGMRAACSEPVASP